MIRRSGTSSAFSSSNSGGSKGGIFGHSTTTSSSRSGGGVNIEDESSGGTAADSSDDEVFDGCSGGVGEAHAVRLCYETTSLHSSDAAHGSMDLLHQQQRPGMIPPRNSIAPIVNAIRTAGVSLPNSCLGKRTGKCQCRIVAVLLLFSLGVMYPITLMLIESQYPTVPLQFHFDVESAITQMDDLRIGKSCLYTTQNGWKCQSCTESPPTAATTLSRGYPTSTPTAKCQILKPKGICKSFVRNDWDTSSKSVSQHDPFNAAADVKYRTLSHAGRYTYYSQPQCTVTNKECFDLERCRHRQQLDTVNETTIHDTHYGETLHTAPLAVYVNMTNSQHISLLDRAIEHSVIRLVEDYRDACLILVFPTSYDTAHALYSAEHWQSDAGHEGRNHLIFNMSRFQFNRTKRLKSDAPISLFHVGFSAVASDSLTTSVFRSGYDQALPLNRHWGRRGFNTWSSNKTFDAASAPPAVDSRNDLKLDLHRPRRWMLSFRGTIKDMPHPYYQHRWLAMEYWDTSKNDVFVDVQCVECFVFGAFARTVKDYYHSAQIYDSLMWESTFGFAPGGSGVGSYRFAEILSTGGIPVVTPDLILPLAPEVDWSGCIVQVTETRIIDLPRLLREMTLTEIQHRQRRCWQLFQTIIGDKEHSEGLFVSDEQVTFEKSMQIWTERTQNAIALNDQLRAITLDGGQG